MYINILPLVKLILITSLSFLICFSVMAKLVQAPTRFTHQDWTTSNLTKYANAESERAAAERLVEESKRLSLETEKRTEKTQRDVNKKFRKYICYTEYELFVIFFSIIK